MKTILVFSAPSILQKDSDLLYKFKLCTINAVGMNMLVEINLANI